MIFRINKRAAKAFALLLTTISTLLLCLGVSGQAQTPKKVEDLVKSISGGKLKVETRAVP